MVKRGVGVRTWDSFPYTKFVLKNRSSGKFIPKIANFNHLGALLTFYSYNGEIGMTKRTHC